ncbi:MAG: ribonuclease P protein component [Chloroflexi bacterium]|jgi:ribonuclease P protein component|nr:MAG: ribonuclease P protein component [Chloroflexota bacterium]
MQRHQRLRHRRDFAAVYGSGRSYARGPLALRIRSNPETNTPRYGFAVGKRLGGAVVRNRIKRRLRESARASGADGRVDIVVIARNGSQIASFIELRDGLLTLLARAGLLAGENE